MRLFCMKLVFVRVLCTVLFRNNKIFTQTLYRKLGIIRSFICEITEFSNEILIIKSFN